jgi:hypothetical protein
VILVDMSDQLIWVVFALGYGVRGNLAAQQKDSSTLPRSSLAQMQIATNELKNPKNGYLTLQ